MGPLPVYLIDPGRQPAIAVSGYVHNAPLYRHPMGGKFGGDDGNDDRRQELLYPIKAGLRRLTREQDSRDQQNGDTFAPTATPPPYPLLVYV